MDAPQIRAPVVAVRLAPEAVELQVHLDALPVLFEKRHQRRVLRDPDAVRVDEHADDVAGERALDDGLELRVDRRLAAAEHEHVQPTVLARQPLVEVGEDGFGRHDARAVWGGGGEAGGAAQVARLQNIFEQDARVLRLHLAQPVEVGGGHGREVARRVGRVALGGRRPLFEVGEDLGHLVVERFDVAMHRAAAHEPHAPVFFGEIAREALHVRERRVGIERARMRGQGRALARALAWQGSTLP